MGGRGGGVRCITLVNTQVCGRWTPRCELRALGNVYPTLTPRGLKYCKVYPKRRLPDKFDGLITILHDKLDP
jgi:hypothetical protein